MWVASQLYYPEETSTGHVLTGIAEGIAAHHPVHVLCGQPAYAKRGMRAPAREEHNGVRIERCWGTTLNKNAHYRRLINFVTITASLFLRAVCRFRRGDIVFVVTNPPLLPFLIALACRLRGARCVLIVHDVYPEVLVATGMARATSLPVRVMGWLNRRLYRVLDRIVVIGRDMGALATRKLGGDGRRVAYIPNWVDVGEIRPGERHTNKLLHELGLQDKFVVQVAGNMGRAQAVEAILESARLLADDPDIHFLFIGSGAKGALITEAAARLETVTALPPRPRSDEPNFLNACDVTLITLVPGMAGIGVPSRLVTALAAGKPIIAAVDPGSELDLVVREEGVGWVAPPDQPAQLAAAIREARADRERLADMGLKARAAAQRLFAREVVIDSYLALIEEMDGE